MFYIAGGMDSNDSKKSSPSHSAEAISSGKSVQYNPLYTLYVASFALIDMLSKHLAAFRAWNPSHAASSYRISPLTFIAEFSDFTTFWFFFHSSF